MAKSCVCYINDSGYLLPALVSAAQARRQISTDAADIVIACIDEPDARSPIVQRVAQALSVELIYVKRSAIEDMHIMFARLFVHKILPQPYDRVIYIDSDTQIGNTLEPLAAAPIPPGHFLACRDPAVLFAQLSKTWMKRILAERAEIGFPRPYGDYFNSGVLVVERDSWPELSAACVAMVQEKGQTLRYPDQDILNLAIGDHCTLISHRWNFPGFLIGSKSEQTVRPSIYHFMSNPRPWNEAVPPWGEAWSRPYGELLQAHPELSFLTPRKSARQTVRYWLQQGYKIATEYHATGGFLEPQPDLAI